MPDLYHRRSTMRKTALQIDVRRTFGQRGEWTGNVTALHEACDIFSLHFIKGYYTRYDNICSFYLNICL